MRSIVLTEPGILCLTESPPPEPPGMDEVQVRVHQVGICGTDLHAFQGNQPFFSYPRVLGHELAVEVVAIGPTNQSHSLRPGYRCCIRPYLNCGKCGACRRGFENCCENMSVLGVHEDGGMSELLNVPLDNLHKSTLSDDELALVEMLSIGAHAVQRANVLPGERILVVGVGPIGLGVSLFAQEGGAQVITADLSDSRLEFAHQQLGIKHRINGKENMLEQLKAIISDDLPTVVFDATGSLQSMMKSLNYTAHGGRLVFVGLAGGNVTFSDPDFHKRELTLLASRNATRQDFDDVIALLEARRVDVTPWITHRASPDHILTDFPHWLDVESNLIKAMLTF